MFSLLPVLANDPDLPLDARLALHLAQAAPSAATKEAAKRRAAASLVGLFDLTAPEIADLLDLPEVMGRA
jgi:hypothetical protein